jgi:hypothetical protein
MILVKTIRHPGGGRGLMRCGVMVPRLGEATGDASFRWHDDICNFVVRLTA